MKRRILIVEDEADIANLVQLHLGELADEVLIARDGRDGLARATSEDWDLVVLDLRLPGVDGLDICRRLREAETYTPVLMLTARSTEPDRIVGLEIGADDYLTKPFSVRELVARVRAIFRRSDALQSADDAATREYIKAEELAIDAASRDVQLAGHSVSLTAKEFDLLLHFARHPGVVFTRSQLLDQVWGYGHDGYEHTVNSHINRLRAKIEPDPATPHYVNTVWGVGYRFMAR
ncbi:MAG: response regulator transcription factor [Gammaproteobacteria bacterium]